jgi:hypothetical protein
VDGRTISLIKDRPFDGIDLVEIELALEISPILEALAVRKSCGSTSPCVIPACKLVRGNHQANYRAKRSRDRIASPLDRDGDTLWEAVSSSSRGSVSMMPDTARWMASSLLADAACSGSTSTIELR